MREKLKSESDSSHAINLDSKQREELDKLIESLKKEVVLPKGKTGARIAVPKLGRG
jgi:hypothetical protein